MALVPVPVLSDDVVTLRAHGEQDVDAIVEQCRDPQSLEWTNVPTNYTRGDALTFVREAMPGGWATDQEWGFAVEYDGAFAGTVSLRNQGARRAEIAFGAHPAARGSGAMERAVRLLLEWGFSSEGRGLSTVIWYAFPGNWASRRLAWKVGFAVNGTLARWIEQHGDLRDVWAGTLLATDERTPRHPWLEVPRIIGENVTLRVHRDDDLPRVLEAGRDQRTAYWLGGLPQPYTDAIGAAFLRDRGDGMARGTDLHWMIADPLTDLLLGTVSIMGLESPTGPEIGYWTHPAARGRGVMTEAVRLACRHAFIPVEDGGLGLPKLRLVSAIDNTASRRVAEANGFRELGIERLGTRCRDGWHDTAIYDLVADELT